jgi:DMSO/TMAO reductase YedYZ molybdopterin-dependent catalytic subunit
VPAAVSLDVPGVAPFVTPTEDFYRIDTALVVPQVRSEDWTLQITGRVDRPVTITYEQLLARPMIERIVTIACVSNEVGGDLIGTARWLGCRLDDLLAEAGIQSGADQIVGVSVDGFTAGFPTALLDGRDAMVVVGMNGEPLTAKHGFPARLVVPGVYGYVSATKWLSEIRLTRFDEFEGYWIPRGWAVEAPILTQSRIDVPRAGARLTAGEPTPIAGVAWAVLREVTRVEVQVDDGPWGEAELGEAYERTTWRQWVLPWTPTAGEHTIRVRATDSDGVTQTSEVTDVAPDGARGWHTVSVVAS